MIVHSNIELLLPLNHFCLETKKSKAETTPFEWKFPIPSVVLAVLSTFAAYVYRGTHSIMHMLKHEKLSEAISV